MFTFGYKKCDPSHDPVPNLQHLTYEQVCELAVTKMHDNLFAVYFKPDKACHICNSVDVCMHDKPTLDKICLTFELPFKMFSTSLSVNLCRTVIANGCMYTDCQHCQHRSIHVKFGCPNFSLHEKNVCSQHSNCYLCGKTEICDVDLEQTRYFCSAHCSNIFHILQGSHVPLKFCNSCTTNTPPVVCTYGKCGSTEVCLETRRCKRHCIHGKHGHCVTVDCDALNPCNETDRCPKHCSSKNCTHCVKLCDKQKTCDNNLCASCCTVTQHDHCRHYGCTNTTLCTRSVCWDHCSRPHLDNNGCHKKSQQDTTSSATCNKQQRQIHKQKTYESKVCPIKSHTTDSTGLCEYGHNGARCSKCRKLLVHHKCPRGHTISSNFWD